MSDVNVAGTVPTADATAKKAVAKNPNQSAIQLPKYAQKVADELGTKLDEKTKHVLAAAVLLFREQSPEVQVAAITAAKVEYAKNAVVA